MDTQTLALCPSSFDSGLTNSQEQVPCPLCASANSSAILRATDPTTPVSDGWAPSFCVVQCRTCGLHFTNPRPSPEDIHRFYPSDYAPHQFEKLRPCTRPGWHSILGRSPERRGLAWHGQGRLLDFGCGSGAFLQLMRQQGWTVQGVDSADAAVEHLKLLGIPAFQGSLPHPELPRESFDVVTMWSSLEHVHDPLETLRAAADLLVPGGQLHLVVPNFESWSARNFGEAWFGLDLPRHLTHFTSDTLGIMTRKAGFEIERCTTLRHSSWLQKSAKLAIRKRRATLVQRLLRLRPVSHAASFVCHLLGASDALYLQARRP